MEILFVIPGDINLPTGGYRYDKEIIREWRNAGLSVRLRQLEGDYPFPSDQHKSAAINSLMELVSTNTADIAVVDGLAGGAHPDLVVELSKLLPTVSLVHHPLCLENGLNETQAKQLMRSEQRTLTHASAIVTTSPVTAKKVSELFQTDVSRIHSVLPGIKRLPTSMPAKTGAINLLCVGSIIERKGHRDLINALAELRHLSWHLDCVGSTTLDPELFAELNSLIKTRGLADRVTFHGSIEHNKLEHLYEQAHVFVLPSLYEGYGMAYAEAIVAGLPVIGTTGGAIPETVPDKCGILVKPGNISELHLAIATMIEDKDKRESYRLSARAARDEFPDWKTSATEFATILINLTKKADGQ